MTTTATKLPENIRKACKLAKKPGSCEYVDENFCPICVIAKLYVIEGGLPEVMAKWRNTQCVNVDDPLMETLFAKYGREFLYNLQGFWDSNPSASNKDLIAKAETLWMSINEQT